MRHGYARTPFMTPDIREGVYRNDTYTTAVSNSFLSPLKKTNIAADLG